MVEIIVGKALGKLVILLFAFYALMLGALVTRNFSEFIEVVAMPETPQLPLLLIILIAAVYLTLCGVKTLGKWAMLALPFLVFIVAITVIFSVNIFDKTFFYPILNNPPAVSFFGAYETLAFPLAETVIFLDLLYYIKKEANLYKMYILGVSIGSLLLIIVMTRNILVLGPDLIEISYFPSFSAAKAIQTGKILQRIEGTIAINFVLGGITKITVCMLFATKAIAKLLCLPSHQLLIIPCGLIMLAVAANSFISTIEMFSFINIYALYAFPFQILLPVLLWITAEIKHRKSQKSSAS